MRYLVGIRAVKILEDVVSVEAEDAVGAAEHARRSVPQVPEEWYDPTVVEITSIEEFPEELD